MTLVRVINRFQLKEHLYTFELLPKRDPLRFSSFLQGSITTHLPHTPPNLSLIHHHSSELHTFLCSPQKHEFIDPLRLSSFLQGSICIHSPCSPPNIIQIQHRTSEMHSIPTQRALIYLWPDIPLNRPNFRFRSYSQGSTGVHPPCQRTRSHRNPTPYVRATVVLLNEKVSVHTISNWKRRVTYASDRFTSENSCYSSLFRVFLASTGC